MSYIIVFLIAVGMGAFGLSYLAHRFEPQMERMLDRWWGIPVLLMGAPTVIIVGAIGVSDLVAASL